MFRLGYIGIAADWTRAVDLDLAAVAPSVPASKPAPVVKGKTVWFTGLLSFSKL